MDMAESFEGQLYDKALVDIAVSMSPFTKYVEWVDIPTNRQKEINSQAKEMYLACAFISQSYPRRHGRLKEELENDFTEVSDTYPQDIVKAYQFLK